MYGSNASRYFQRPKYSEINKDKIYYRKKNKEGIEKLRIKYTEKNANDNKLLKVLRRPSVEDNLKRRQSHNTDSPVSQLSRRPTREHELETPASRLSQSFSNITHVRDNSKSEINLKKELQHHWYLLWHLWKSRITTYWALIHSLMGKWSIWLWKWRKKLGFQLWFISSRINRWNQRALPKRVEKR